MTNIIFMDCLIIGKSYQYKQALLNTTLVRYDKFGVYNQSVQSVMSKIVS